MRLTPQSRPRLASFARLQHDPHRDRWILQAPERLFVPDEVGLDVLSRCDGRLTLSTLTEMLAEEYAVPPEQVASDVLELLQDLADKGIVVDARS